MERSQNFQSAIAPLIEKMQRRHEAIKDAMRPLVEMMQKSSQVRPAVMAYLIDCGWFVTMDFPIGWFVHLEEWRVAGQHDEVEAAMSRFARGQADETERLLGERFPARTAILADAFAAHRERRYTLSIPVLLAQADGIGCEILGRPRQFFKSKRPKALKGKLAEFELFGEPYTPWGVFAEMLGQLDGNLSIEVDTDRRDERRRIEEWFCPLNRHGVLHGIDTDYPSEANSLRCVLLLRYLLDADRILREQIPDKIEKLKSMWAEAEAASDVPEPQ